MWGSFLVRVSALEGYQKLAKRATITFPELTLRSAGRSYQKLLSEVVCKAAPERSRKLLFFKESVDQSCSGKQAKAAPQSGSPKLLPKAVPQSISAKRLPQSGMLQTCSTKHLPKAILQSGSRKLLPTVAAESIRKLPPKLRSKASPSCSPKLRFFKASVRSCRAKLLLKAAPASQCCSPKLLHKAVPQSRSPKLYRKLLRRAAPRSCLKLLPTAASQSCYLKLLPKTAVLQSNCSSSCCNAAKPQSCFPLLFPKAALQSCYRKRRPKETPQNSAHRLRKQAQCVR